MTNITQNTNGTEAMAAINAALLEVGSSVTVGNESGLSVSTILNTVFGDTYLTSSQSGSEWVQAVEDGFESMDSGDTPSPDEHIKVSFLHISDTHGATAGLNKCIELLSTDNSLSYLLVSGDLQTYSTNSSGVFTIDDNTLKAVVGILPPIEKEVEENGVTTTELVEDTKVECLTDIDLQGTNKMLYVAGNHDRFDTAYKPMSYYIGDVGLDSKANHTRRWMHYLMGNSVNWGAGNNNKDGSYWYKDITTEGKTVRVIGVDQYVYASPKNLSYYSQTQVNWLLDLLYNTPSDYCILIMMHEPPMHNPNTDSVLMQPNENDTTEERNQKLFVSELFSDFHGRSGMIDYNLLPRIMKGYLHSENMSFTYQESFYELGSTTVKNVLVTKDFTNNEPAYFLGFVCGHAHGDCVGYLPNEDWSDQLMMCVPSGDSSIAYSSRDDLLWKINSGKGTRYASDEPSYRINKLTIDFTAKTLTIERIGNKTSAKYSTGTTLRPYGNRVRNSITFPFIKAGQNQ